MHSPFSHSWLYTAPLSLFILPTDENLVYRLEDLWLNDNQIESIEGIAEAVVGSREKLTTIYLEHNPCV